ncbi:unnamed protein product, partial [Cuscuta europaea]
LSTDHRRPLSSVYRPPIIPPSFQNHACQLSAVCGAAAALPSARVVRQPPLFFRSPTHSFSCFSLLYFFTLGPPYKDKGVEYITLGPFFTVGQFIFFQTYKYHVCEVFLSVNPVH